MTGMVGTKVWDSEELSRALGGAYEGYWVATGVSIDSRSINPGDLFIAIEGSKNDGHNFLQEVLDSCAAAAIVHKDKQCGALQVVRVKDTIEALNKMAGYARSRTNAKVIAETGSVGKTSTKEMLKLMLSEQGSVSASEGNLNNHWGLPLSLSRMPEDSEFGIFEIGMSAPGEIAELSEISLPDVGMITAVEYAHSQFFDSIEGIANAKAEIVNGMDSDGTLILNRDSFLFEHLKSVAVDTRDLSIKTFGKHKQADYRLTGVSRAEESMIVEADLEGEPITFEIGVLGEHWAKNALAAIAGIASVGADAKKAAEKLKEFSSIAGRGQTIKINTIDGNSILIDESYNANPASMRAAIKVLGEYPMKKKNGRRIAVLGDMLELGGKTVEFHKNLSEPLQLNLIDLVFLVGTEMAELWNILPERLRGGYAETAQKLSSVIISQIRAGDVIMAKGSLGSNVGSIVDDLKNLNAGPDTKM